MTRVKDNYNVTSKDEKWLFKYLESVSEVNEVKDYLDRKKLVIEVKPCYDGQSGWSGENIYLQGRNLSINGYCFSGKILLEHVRKFEEFEKISSSEAFKKHLEERKNFKEVVDFLNLGRDQFNRIK